VIAAEPSADLRRRLTLTSQTLTPAELHLLCVIDELCDAGRLAARADTRARDLARQPAFRLVKEQIRRATLARLREIVASGQDALIDTLGRSQPD
jgi:hypothetical protein